MTDLTLHKHFLNPEDRLNRDLYGNFGSLDEL